MPDRYRRDLGAANIRPHRRNMARVRSASKWFFLAFESLKKGLLGAATCDLQYLSLKALPGNVFPQLRWHDGRLIVGSLRVLYRHTILYSNRRHLSRNP